MSTETLRPILGTGLSGLVGSGLTKHLADQYTFHNLDLQNGVDILKPDSIDSMMTAHPAPVMLHLAGFTDVNAAAEQEGDTTGSCYQVNVVGTQNIAQACAQHRCHLIHISTGYVFDGHKNAPYLESDAVNPTDWYSKTKNEAEQYLLEHHPEATILRINFPYRQDEFPKADIWHKMAANLQAEKTGPYFADHYFTLTPIEWLVPVIAWCIEHQPAGIFHATTDHVYSDFTLAQEIQMSLGLEHSLQVSSVHEYNRTTARPYQPSLILSNQKLKTAMGQDFPHA